MAIERGHLELALLLLDRGADANAWAESRFCGYGSETPLHMAIKRGHLELALLLLDRGADANARTRSMNVST